MANDGAVKRAENEAAFREANERIEAAAQALAPPLAHVPFLCECDDVRCRDVIALSREEYEHIRGDGARFVIVAGHSTAGEVIEDHEGYVVVRKTDGEAAVARALDPRGDRQ